jgi:glycerol-3-phosphate acyltransferase PlsX
MGGDNAPRETVRGALEAREEGVGVVLVGREADVSPHLPANLDGLSLVQASQVIDSHEPPVKAVRLKPHSSIRVGLGLVKSGEAQAFVSAGSTGAVVAGALLVLGRLPGLERPALGLPYATPSGPAILLDVGANADCRPLFLLQFGHLGARYMQRVWGIASPRIALLSSGEEEEKGNRLVRETYSLLKKSGLNFTGNLEGKDLLRGLAEVVVSDGFTGNVILKATEGFGEAIYDELRNALTRRVYLRPLALLLRPALKEVVRKMDYNEYGGAPLLGVQGNVFVAHGRSKALAIKNALLLAHRVVSQEVLETLTEERWQSLQ